MATKMADSCPNTSLALKAFQLSVAAAQERSPDDDWDYLEHIEAPQWIDLSCEASLEGTEGDDPWFYQHHPHHETPLVDLVFTPTRPSKEKQRRKRPESPTEEDFELKLEAATSLADKSESEKPGELNHGPLWPRAKAKRVQLLPERTEHTNVKEENKNERLVSPLRPSDAFTAKLLSTLMARLRTSDESQASPDSSLSDSKIANKMTTEDASTKHSEETQVKKLRHRASVAVVPITQRSQGDVTEHVVSKQDKENANSTSLELNAVKKPKTLNVRKSLATFDLGKNASAAFSIGRNDSGGAQRRRLSCVGKSPRLKHARMAKPSRASHPDNSLRYKARTYGAGGDDLAALIAKHNSKFQPKPQYEPRLHSTRDIRQWERRTGLQYYNLQPVERVKVNQEIADYKRSRIP